MKNDTHMKIQNHQITAQTAGQEWRYNMTVHDLLEYGECVLREDKEYWAEMDRLKSEMEKLIYRQNKIMAAAIIRLAVAMVTEHAV